MNITTNDIKLKSGDVIAAGEATIQWQDGAAYCHWAGAKYRISRLSAAKALGIEQPSMDELEHMVYDGIALSIMGHNVEPDGIDPDGSPSWLMALGMI